MHGARPPPGGRPPGGRFPALRGRELRCRRAHADEAAAAPLHGLPDALHTGAGRDAGRLHRVSQFQSADEPHPQ